jgi:hypothetical protein
LQIVWQLRKGSSITWKFLKWLAETIRVYNGQLPQLAPDCMTESDRCEKRKPSAPTVFNFIKHTPTSEYGYVPIRLHTMRVFRNTREMVFIL